MRPRTKKHFTERYERCRHLVVDDPAALKGAWRCGDMPLHLEIGCGKGSFITGMALQHPDISFVALEVVPNVLLAALEKIDSQPEINNVRFICCDARRLRDFFADDELDAIYLNFSDPWPRPKQFKNRLTHPDFLNMYSALLREGGVIRQKTDNKPLFDFSVRSYNECGFDIQIVPDAPADNIMTEYEQRFTELGMPIYRVNAVNRKNASTP